MNETISLQDLDPRDIAKLERMKTDIDAALLEVPSHVVLAALAIIAGRVSVIAEWDGHPREVIDAAVVLNFRAGVDEGETMVRQLRTTAH